MKQKSELYDTDWDREEKDRQARLKLSEERALLAYLKGSAHYMAEFDALAVQKERGDKDMPKLTEDEKAYLRKVYARRLVSDDRRWGWKTPAHVTGAFIIMLPVFVMGELH